MGAINYENVRSYPVPSAAKTATWNTGDFVNQNCTGIMVFINLTAFTATGSLTVTVQGKINGNYYTIIAGSAITSATTQRLWAFPGATVTANVSANEHVPFEWRLLMTHGNGVSLTYDITCDLLI